MTAGGATRRWVAAPGSAFVTRVRVAGRYVAWVVADDRRRPTDRLSVVDRISGRTVLTARRRFFDLALQADGTIAVLESIGPGRLDVMRASPSSPSLRRVATRAENRGVALAAGRVVFAAEHDDLADELVLVPLSGGRRQSLVRHPFDGPRIAAFDFDGTHVAWYEYDGDGSTFGRVNLLPVP